MLIYSSVVSENAIHVWRPLAEQVSRKILQDLGYLDYMQNHIYIDSKMHGPSKSWKDNQSRQAILNEPGFHANIKFSANSMGLKWDVTTPGQHMDPALHRRDNFETLPLFFDLDTGVHIIERYLPCNIEMECDMVFTDSEVAFDAVSRLHASYNVGELLAVPNLTYNYPVPLDLLGRLYRIGQISGVKKGCFQKWIEIHSNKQMFRLVARRDIGKVVDSKSDDMDIHSKEMVVRKDLFETLVAIGYDMDEPTMSGVGSSPDTIAIHFNITIQFGRVNMLYLKYPIAINNQLLPADLVPPNPKGAYGRLVRSTRHPYLAIDPALQVNKFLYTLPARNPWYDNWQLPTQSYAYQIQAKPFFIGVFTLDNVWCCKCECPCCDNCEHRYTVIDLHEDLDRYKLTDVVRDSYLSDPIKALAYDTEYTVSVFADNVQIDPSVMEFDGRYLKIPNTLNAQKIHRLVLTKKPPTQNCNPQWFLVLDCIIEVNAE